MSNFSHHSFINKFSSMGNEVSREKSDTKKMLISALSSTALLMVSPIIPLVPLALIALDVSPLSLIPSSTAPLSLKSLSTVS